MSPRGRSATETCLKLPEIVQMIGSYLFEASDLYAASSVNHLWQAALLPVRSQFPHVDLNYVSSFLSFLKSNRRAALHCRALRILCNDIEDEDNSESINDTGSISDAEMADAAEGGENRDTTASTSTSSVVRPKKKDLPLELEPVVDILKHLAQHGGLQFFMYALPGEPCMSLPDDTWTILQKMTGTLQGLYIELVVKHWNVFLSSQFTNLTYLRLFLDSDEPIPAYPQNGAFDPKAALATFLQSHPRLEILHLYLGQCFTGFPLSSISLPSLRSFLLISKAEGVDVAQFIKAHPDLTSLDVYTDSEVTPFPADSLPNIQALQISAMTLPWFKNVIDSAPQRTKPLRHLQVTAARQENFDEVLRQAAPLGKNLRCLELIFWSRDVPLLRVLKDVNRAFPNLVELSLFIPSWGASDWEAEEKPFELASMLECFASNTHMLAFSVSDPKTDLLEKETVEESLKTRFPPNLQYIVWRSQTFRINRNAIGDNEGVMLTIERTYHPRNYRGSRYLRDWHEEMVFDHLAGEYEAQLELR